jgi:hypothetical protein
MVMMTNEWLTTRTAKKPTSVASAVAATTAAASATHGSRTR